MRFDDILKLIGGNNIDRLGTAIGAPELGWSERANNNRPTVNTGVTPQSKAAGLDKWVDVHFNQPKGGNQPLTPVQTATSGYRSVSQNPGQTNQPSAPGGIDEVALAEQARRNRINSYKAQAGNIRSQAQGTFDNLLKQVNAFRERAKTQWSNAGQEITNRASDILGSNARTARETVGEARARGRALGLGDSSKFNLQNKISGNFAATQGNTIARRGEEERANQNLYQERQDQAQGQENEANTYLRNALDRATAIENTGYDAGEEVFANSLNDIVNYQRQLASIRPVQAEGLTQYAPNFSGIANTVNGILSKIGTGQGTTEEDFGNPVNPTDIFSLLKRRGLVSG